MKEICKIADDMIIVRLYGDLDHHVTESVRNEIDKAIENMRIYRIAFDFKNVSFMDSSGIGLIMGRYKKIKPVGGEIYVCNMNCQMNRIFDLFGLEKITSKSKLVDAIVNKEDTYEQV